MKAQITSLRVTEERIVIRGKLKGRYDDCILRGKHRIIPGVGWWVEVDASHAIQRRVVAP